MAGVAGVHLLVAGVALALASACGSSDLVLVNDTGHDVRLSGCFIDESLDITASERIHQDLPGGRWGCNVYTPPGSDTRYLGCLMVNSGGDVNISQLQPKVSQSRCEKVR